MRQIQHVNLLDLQRFCVNKKLVNIAGLGPKVAASVIKTKQQMRQGWNFYQENTYKTGSRTVKADPEKLNRLW